MDLMPIIKKIFTYNQFICGGTRSIPLILMLQYIFVIYVVVVYRRYCCYNFLDKCERHDCDGTMINDSDQFIDRMGGDELMKEHGKCKFLRMEYFNDDDDDDGIMRNGVLIHFSSSTIISLFLSNMELYWISVTNNKVGRTTVHLSNRILYFFFFFIEQVHAWIVSLDSVVVCVCCMMQKGIQHMD